MKKAWVLSYPLRGQQRLWSDWVDAQADLSLRWAHTHFVVLSWGGSIMFKPMLLFHKTAAVCPFRTPQTFLHTWLIRPPFTIVPRGVSLQVLRFCDLVLFYPSSVQHCDPLAMESFAGCLLVCPCLWFHVLSNLLLLLRKLPCTLLTLMSPFVLTARELSRYTYALSMPINSLFG